MGRAPEEVGLTPTEIAALPLTARALMLVTGSREQKARRLVERTLADTADELLGRSGVPPILIHGKYHRGVDKIAADWADRQPRRRIAWPEPFEANWGRWGMMAGPYRNAAMVERASVQSAAGGLVVVLAFPRGASTGTRGTVDLARQAGFTDIRVVEMDD